MLIPTLPDNFYDDERIIRAGTLAAGLFMKAVSYSVTHHTKGFIHYKLLDYLTPDADEYIGSGTPSIDIAILLRDVGFFSDTETGFMINDFGQYCFDDGRE